MKNLLGGKGANLAEMNLIGIPVPPGFTITTDVCTEYNTLGRDKVVELLKDDVVKAIANVEALMKSKFGDIDNPLLVSVRSGARASMPGMMDTILNLGLNDEVVEGIIRKTGNARFAWDSYRRFVQMYGDVVLGMKPTNKEDIDPFEKIIEEVKHAKGVKLDNELEVEDLKELVKKFKAAVKEQTGKDFPTCAYEQLWGAICAVFDSWMNERAILYRKMEGIPDEWGTAVNVQAMEKMKPENPLYIHLSRACSLALSASGAALLKMIPIPNFSPGPRAGSMKVSCGLNVTGKFTALSAVSRRGTSACA